MPFKDPEQQKQYMREYQKEYKKRKRLEKQNIDDTQATVEFPKTDKSVEEILNQHVSVTTPATETKKKGRPKLQTKPTYSKNKYTENPVSRAVDLFLVNFTNRITHKPDLMKKEDCEIGEAVVYLMDYYGTGFLNHPVAILIFAVLGFGLTMIEKSQEYGKTQPKTEPEKKVMSEAYTGDLQP